MMRMSRFARKPRETFGLDIGTSAVKVVQLREGPGGFTLIALGSAPLPIYAIGDGTIKAPDAVAAAIRNAVARGGIKTREAVIGIAGRELISKKVQLP